MQDPLSDEAFYQAIELSQNPRQPRPAFEFFTSEIEDEAATEKEGRPMFKTVEMIRKWTPGDRTNVVVERVKYAVPDPRKEFAAEYKQWKAGEQAQVQGQLLSKWGLIDPATAKGYEAIGILTVEQLAEVSDANATKVRGLSADRQKAKDFLSMAAGQQPIAQARAEAEKLREELRALKDQLDDLKAANKKGKG